MQFLEKVILTLSIAALAVIACNKEDANLNVENPYFVSSSESVSTISVKTSGGHFSKWVYKAVWTDTGGKDCINGGTNCSKWIPSSILVEKLDEAILGGKTQFASFFENEISGTELESIREDREIYAKFISGNLYAEKIISEENIIYLFYEIIDNNEVDFIFFDIE